MKKSWVWVAIVIVIIVLLLGYLGRHKIKSMLGMTSPTPTAQTSMTPTPSATSSAAAIVMTKTNPKKGNYLTDPKGMTLYVFDNDTKGVSNCNGSCASLWPPYLESSQMSSMPSNINTIKRADGKMQYAYNGMPLYYYANDKVPGDTTGDGVGGTWHLVKP